MFTLAIGLRDKELTNLSDAASITCLCGVISGRVGVVTGFVSQPQATVVSPTALVSFKGALP